MSKIVCDICGTAYPETTDKCPICGSAKQIEGNASEPAAEGGEQAAKTVTKGGHFSNSNVRRRNKGKKVAAKAKKPVEKVSTEDEQKDEPKRGLVAVVGCC